MITDYVRLWKARTWMKSNEPFLSSWHAYVGYELDLFEEFKKPVTVQQVAVGRDLEQELLSQWVDVGVVLKHLKKDSKERVKTIRKWKLPMSKGSDVSSGVLLKEMMELHIPSLIKYPELMKTKKRQHFDADHHGETVAKTSSLLEKMAFPEVEKLVRKEEAEQVLDIGCGEAGYVMRLGEKFPKKNFTGIEIHEEVAKHAMERVRDHSNISIVNQDLYSFHPEKQYDLIMANNILHYIDPTTRTTLFSQIHEWLQEDGVLSVITPIQRSKYGKQFSSAFNSFFTSFDNLYPIPSEQELEDIAKASNFTLEDSKPIVKEGGWYIVTFRKN
ncbi:methyltransferase type 12 [Bacillus coahuilensis m2-6]|uniref:Methyltransferase type 12 n=1 Tax=Bacillus coahuilensis p1.1.43 TaxID=1150625 RepID=A0A147KBZ1_9BACI|nr:class I SAM-dependent methyltransferase [Bacillus coahuilensis]KUP09088.1 methyltransferase type 12 [Bacillus coahuilensis p1.1.43]KUP09861.1 methyltransferase type 12 [Bacillus coahuilensis m2-6]